MGLWETWKTSPFISPNQKIPGVILSLLAQLHLSLTKEISKFHTHIADKLKHSSANIRMYCFINDTFLLWEMCQFE